MTLIKLLKYQSCSLDVPISAKIIRPLFINDIKQVGRTFLSIRARPDFP